MQEVASMPSHSEVANATTNNYYYFKHATRRHNVFTNYGNKYN